VTAAPSTLPDEVGRQIDEVVAAMRSALGDELSSIVLYGSAAEGRLRPTSDVNLMIVLSRFDPPKLDATRDALLVARATVRIAPMFVLDDELDAAAQSFAVKFNDVLHRRVVLYGVDPLAHITIPREAKVKRLRQVLLNLAMRMRQMYVMRSSREEQVALVVADSAGPLRVSAATLLELEETPAANPKEALNRVAGSIGGDDWAETLDRLSVAREERMLPPGQATPTLVRLIDLATAMRKRADRLA
jgi:predicted nucleotidyltransferase